ncbi:hypothetical protein [Sorangium cellulosum]|uniref:hypothetical protein n=1 Tax=Sorangium cellulosum TaxID=56 RepID=UPI001011242E|nr:hypothetical protein [Sorangium cellulosum]
MSIQPQEPPDDAEPPARRRADLRRDELDLLVLGADAEGAPGGAQEHLALAVQLCLFEPSVALALVLVVRCARVGLCGLVGLGLGGLALAALELGGLDGARVGGVVVEEAGAEVVGAGLVEGEVGPDLVLEAELPGVGLGGVVFPEAAVGDGEARVLLALVLDAGGEVAAGEVGPVVVLAARTARPP